MSIPEDEIIGTYDLIFFILFYLFIGLWFKDLFSLSLKASCEILTCGSFMELYFYWVGPHFANKLFQLYLFINLDAFNSNKIVFILNNWVTFTNVKQNKRFYVLTVNLWGVWDSDLFCLFVRSVEGGVGRAAVGEHDLQEGASLWPSLHAWRHWYTHSHRHTTLIIIISSGHLLNSPNIHRYILQCHHHVSPPAAQKVCHLLSVNVTDFTRAILSPRIKVCIAINA